GGGLETVTTIFRRLEVRFGFDRIGRQLDELRRLVELGPNYLKVDRSLVLCPPEEDKGFLKSLARLAHDQDAELIVVRIEDQEQLHALQDKSVDGYQGYIRPAVKWKLGH
ncbi:MAG TPA: EAL domain-containing protein, partial [Motiliproteus sp.]